MLTETTKRFLTGCLVGILTVKIKQVHNAYVYCLTFYILHKVFQNMDVEQLGSLNFANLVTCGHSYYIEITFVIVSVKVQHDIAGDTHCFNR